MAEEPLTILVNGAGGAAAAAGEGLAGTIGAAFAAAGTAAEVRILEPSQMADAVRAAAAGGRVVVAGGDGTAACAAQALKGSEAELALLPLGTLNHLARDLGIPADIEGAAALAAHGRAMRIDVAEVNGHRFVNNASIGLYPFMVRHRDAARRKSGVPKWLATLPAAWDALARLPHHRLRIDLGEGERPLVTPLLFVGNNRYSLHGGDIGSRASLTDARLNVFAVAQRGRGALIWFALRTLFGFVDTRRDFVAIGECETLTVSSSGGSIEIALDGEVRRLESPLRFTVLAGALAIVAPEESAGRDPAGT
jgi:diacylglycerol kinase family enzyme